MILRAKEQYDKTVNKRKAKEIREDVIKDMESEDSFSESESLPECALNIRNTLNLQKKILEDFNNGEIERQENFAEFQSLPDGGKDFDWNLYAQECFGGQWPSNTSDWLESVDQIAKARENDVNSSCDLPQIDLMAANELQRVIIAITILNIMKFAANDKNSPNRLLIQGTAGVGKTFTIVALTYIARRLFRRNNAVMNLAPTGAASILLPNGKTVHSTTNIPRKHTKNGKSIQLLDVPLSSKALRQLREKTGSVLENEQMKLILLNLDERGMYSARNLAWCCQRFKESTANFTDTFGAIPSVNFFGDLGQLGPVQAMDLHVEPLSSDAPDKLTGYGIYRSFDESIFLHQTMRQGPN